MPDMLSLAEASGTDLARTADIVSDGMTAFNMDLNKTPDAANRFANAMIAAATGSNTSVELMGETFKYAGAVAGSLGYSVEDVALATGLMANASVKGSMAGTALRSTFTRLVKPPKDAAAALQALGVSATNSDGTMKPFRETLGDLRTAFKGLSDAEKAEYAASIAGQEAMAGFLAMMNASDFDYNKLQTRINTAQSKNLLGEVQDIMNDTLEDSFKNLGSAWEGLQIAIGDVFQEPLKELVGNLAEGLGEVVQFIDKHQELAKAAGIAAAAISAVIVAAAGFGVAASGVQFLASSFAMLKTAVTGLRVVQGAMSAFSGLSSLAGLASLASPIGIAVAAALALAAAAYFVYQNWDKVAPVFESLAGTLGGALQGAITTISVAFENLNTAVSRLAPGFSSFGEYIFAGLSVTLNYFANLAATIISTFSNAIAAVISLFGGLGNAIASALAGDWGKAAEHFKNAFVNAGKFVVEAIKSLFGGLADTFTNFFKPLDIMRGIKSDGATSGGGSFGTPQPPQPQQVDNSALIAAIANAVETTQKQTPEADWSKVTAAISTAVESIKQDPKTDIAPLLQQVSTAIESVRKENPNADTSKLESVISAAMDKISAAQKDKSDSAEIVKSVSTAIESLKAQNSEADLSKIEAAITAAVEKSDSSENLAAAISTAIESTKQEQPELDLTPITEAIAAAQQAQVEQKNLEVEPLQMAVTQTADSMSQFAPQMQMAAEGVTQMTAGQQAFNAEVQSSQSTIAATNAQIQASQGALSSFNGALNSTNGGLANLASSSSSAAGAISGLGSAAQAAVSALQSAGANAAAAVSAAAANVGKPAANFRGGIYSKGAFLTTFAEKSPEAAIPIDNSQRAIDLWTKTGQMLGQLPGKNFATQQPSTAERISTIERAQRQRLEQVKIQYEAAKKAGALHSTQVEYDELGNIRGLNGLKDNVITKDDDIQVARAKKAAQLEEWRKSHSTRVESPPYVNVPQKKLPRQVPDWAMGKPTFPQTHSTQVESPPYVNVPQKKLPRQVPDWAMGKPTFPQTHSTQVESPKVPKSIFSGRVKTPDFPNIPMTQTQPRTYDTGLNIGDIFGAIGERLGGVGILSSITERLSASSGDGIIPQLINNLPQQSNSSPIDLHFEINIQGNANAEDVEQGIRQSIPLLEETFERKLANYQHEQQRRSF